MRIKKVSQTTSTQAQVVDGYSTSTTDSYSCNYINNNAGQLQDATPEIVNATMTYTEQECKYKYINKNTIIGTVVLRGNITSISSPAYARIKLNIPNINLRTWSSIAIIQEAMNCTEVVPYSATFVENDIISLQSEGGTDATNWKVANNIYIRVGFIINLN